MSRQKITIINRTNSDQMCDHKRIFSYSPPPHQTVTIQMYILPDTPQNGCWTPCPYL